MLTKQFSEDILVQRHSLIMNPEDLTNIRSEATGDVGDDENYFSLLDVFTCTRYSFNVSNEIILNTIIRDIALSVGESFVLTKQFILDFITEFYIQLTTISWLSVRSVQRQNKSPTISSEDTSSSSSSSSDVLSGLFGSISSILSSESAGVVDDWSDVDVEMMTRAEERVRLAEEIAVNNSLARTRLGMTQIIR